MNNRKLQPIRRATELMDYDSNKLIVKSEKASLSNKFDIDYNNRDTTSPDSNRPEISSLASGESRPQSPGYTLGPKKRLLGNYNQLETYPNGIAKTPSPTNNSDSSDTISTTSQQEHKTSTSTTAAIKTAAPNPAALLTMGLNNLLNGSHRFHPSLSSLASSSTSSSSAQHHYQSFMNSHHSTTNYSTSHNQQQFNHSSYNPSLLQHPHSRLLLPAHLIHLQALSQQGGINNNNSPYRLHQDLHNSFRSHVSASSCLEPNDEDQGSPNSESNNNNNTSADEVEEVDDETGNVGNNTDELDESDDHMISSETDAPVTMINGLDGKLKSNNQLLYEMNMKNTFKSPMRGKSKFKRADCWNYFVTKFCKKTNLYFDHCTIQKNGQVCGSKFVHHGATTRLNKHLIQKHKIKLVIVNKNNDNFGNEEELAAATAAASMANAAAAIVSPSLANSLPSLNYLKQLSPIGLSNSSENNSPTASLNGLRLFDSTSTGVANILSQGINGNSSSSSSMSNSMSTMTTTTTNPVDTDLNMLLISFILSSSTSIELIDNKWFRMFVQNLNGNYKLPTREELGGLFKKLYQEKTNINNNNNTGVAITTAGGNNSNSSNNSAGSPNPSMTSNGSVKD